MNWGIRAVCILVGACVGVVAVPASFRGWEVAQASAGIVGALVLLGVVSAGFWLARRRRGGVLSSEDIALLARKRAAERRSR